MSECINKFYIENKAVLECKDFNDEAIKNGRSIYEVIRIIDGAPLFIEEHIVRLRNSCNLENKAMLLSEDQIGSFIDNLVKENETYVGNVKIVFNYNDEKNKSLFYFIKHSYPDDKLYEKGVETVLYFGERRNPNAKVINTSFNSQVQKLIKEKNVYEAILVDNEGFITEGSRSNIFMVKDGRVLTSPLEAVLPGVTRGIIIDIVRELGIDFEEKKVTYKDLGSLDGLFLTGTSPNVLPIIVVNEFTYKSNCNDVILKIMNKYNEKVKKYIKLQNNR